jgi:hypothetical protein
MLQVKFCNSDKRANEWLRENQDKEVIEIKFSAGGFGIIYKESNE